MSDTRTGQAGSYETIPQAFPGDPVKLFYDAYGKPTDASGNAITWQKNGDNITAYTRHDGSVAEVTVHVNSGTIVKTPDGILLGKDTFRSVLNKAEREHVELQERIESGDGIWALKAYFALGARPNKMSVYVWLLPGSDVVDHQIDCGTPPLHSSLFLGKTVYDYSIEIGTIAEFDRSGGNRSVHN